MPTAAMIVDSTVPTVRMRLTLMPLASAKRGLEPAAVMAMPVRDRENSHTAPQQASRNSRPPVGTLMPNTLNARNLSSRCAKLPNRLWVTRRPRPLSSQMIFGVLKGNIIQPMHISETKEKPT